MFICRDLNLHTTDVAVLRTRVSHSWLGHCILHVSCEQAAEWLRTDRWPELGTAYVEYENDARILADKMSDFSAGILVDELAGLRALPEAVRVTLRSELDEASRVLWNPDSVRTIYLTALQPLLQAFESFRYMRTENRCNPAAVMSAWEEIRLGAQRLKDALHAVPAGVVLP